MNEMRQMGISQTEIRRTEIRQTAGGKQTVLYPAREENRPLIVVNHYSQETDKVAEVLRAMGDPDINLLFVYGLEWEHDMTPWP